MKYYLVYPVNLNPEGKYFWMADNRDTWIGVARGIWRPKHEDDLVKDVFEAESIVHLDWRKTPFHNDASVSGWLSRDGRFYGCPQRFHDTLAYCVLGARVSELENSGWVRVYTANHFVCEHRLSAEQRNWLSLKGYKVQDFH